MASIFNEVIAMELRAWGKQYFLVIVDLATRFCASTVISDKHAPTILRGIFSVVFQLSVLLRRSFLTTDWSLIIVK